MNKNVIAYKEIGYHVLGYTELGMHEVISAGGGSAFGGYDSDGLIFQLDCEKNGYSKSKLTAFILGNGQPLILGNGMQFQVEEK